MALEAHFFLTPARGGDLPASHPAAARYLRLAGPSEGNDDTSRASARAPEELLQDRHLFSTASSSLDSCKALCTRSECAEGGYVPQTSRCYCAGGCLKAQDPGIVLPPSAFDQAHAGLPASTGFGSLAPPPATSRSSPPAPAPHASPTPSRTHSPAMPPPTRPPAQAPGHPPTTASRAPSAPPTAPPDAAFRVRL